MASLWDERSALGRRLHVSTKKLTNLVRRGSTKTLKSKPASAAIAPIAPVLEVDLERVKSLRLGDGWLDDACLSSSPPSPGSRKRRRDDAPGGREDGGASGLRPKPDASPYSTRTPIADLFSMSTDQLATKLDTLSVTRKHVTGPTPSLFEASAPKPQPKAETQVPAEPPQAIRISLKDSTVVTSVAPEARPGSSLNQRRSLQVSRPPPDHFSEVTRRHSVREVNLLRSVGPNTTGLRVSGGAGDGTSCGGGSGAAKRLSITSVTELQTSYRPPIPEIDTTSRNSSLLTPSSATTPTPPFLTPDLRRKSWQPASAVASQQGTTNSMQPPAKRTLTTRPPSAALNSNRLAWIRDLESKKSPSTPSDLPRRQAGGGGVASKLAMFEHIQKVQKPPISALSRSNSNSTASSRVSSAATALSLASVSTGRTSMDSMRGAGSQRNSAVMAYYDDGFRERMEGIAGGLVKQVDGEGEGGLRKVTAKMVDLGSKREMKEEDEPDSPSQEAHFAKQNLLRQLLGKGPEEPEAVVEARVSEETIKAPASEAGEVSEEKKEEPVAPVKEPVVAPEVAKEEEAAPASVESSEPVAVPLVVEEKEEPATTAVESPEPVPTAVEGPEAEVAEPIETPAAIHDTTTPGPELQPLEIGEVPAASNEVPSAVETSPEPEAKETTVEPEVKEVTVAHEVAAPTSAEPEVTQEAVVEEPVVKEALEVEVRDQIVPEDAEEKQEPQPGAVLQ